MEKVTTKILMPSSGITNLTPPQVCEDTELRDCVNLTMYNSAIRPIRKAMLTEITGAANAKLLFVHELNTGGKNYIYAYDTNLYCGSTLIAELPHTIVSVNSIGKTLIVNTSDNDESAGIYYFLWKWNESTNAFYYKPLGNKLPVPNFSFRMSLDGYNWNGSTHKPKVHADCPSVSNATFRWVEPSGDQYYYDNGEQPVKANFNVNNSGYFVLASTDDSAGDKTTIENAMKGLYAECKEKAHQHKAFINPFLVVGAIRLYDGTYTYITNPVLMLPEMKCAFSAFYSWGESKTWGITPSHYLEYKQTTDYSDWDDIIDNVCIFTSYEIDTVDTSDLHMKDFVNNTGANVNVKCVVVSNWHRDWSTLAARAGIDNNKYNSWSAADLYFTNWDKASSCVLLPFKPVDEKDIIDEIKTTGTFFLLCDAGLKAQPTMKSTESLIKKGVLDNITTQEQLKTIDYYSYCPLYPSITQTFNRRLNLANVKRGFFEGFSQFVPYESNSAISSSSHGYNIEVSISTQDGMRTVKHYLNSADIFFSNMWFYYPDPRAKKVTIKDNSNNTILGEISLEEHTGLNGAYYIGSSLPNGTERISASPYVTIPSDILPEPETLQNYVLQSEVDNPFTFNAGGYVHVGQGTILGLAGLTTDLNQDAYKVATTIALTTQGIWAMSIDSAGRYASVAPPYSREVCSNPKSITMVDRGVFFVSRKGLMLIEDSGVKCVSSQMNGRSDAYYAAFNKFLEGCVIAYDYRYSMIWLINSSYSYHWVYNIASGTWSRLNNSQKYISIVKDYPDTLLQTEDFKIHSLYNRVDINDDAAVYSGKFITRPLKFAEALRFKSLRQILHFFDKTSANTSISLSIKASNDCSTWIPVSSLDGRGYKFYELTIEFANLLAADSYAGSIIAYTVSEYNKLR